MPRAAVVIGFITAVCIWCVLASAQIASPADQGFIHFFKCPSDSDTTRIGDTQTAAACLRVCQSQAHAAGCWWLDGTGGFPRECRVCRTRQPQKDIWNNDWAMPIDTVVATLATQTAPD